MKKTIIATAVALVANIASAAEVWEGPGKLYNLNRELLAEYTVNVQIEKVSTSEKKVDVTVRDQGGAVIHSDACTMRNSGQSWTKDCDGGSSRGFMLDYGLGIDYYEANDGKAYATDIVIDSNTQMRLLRTELENGQAQKFFAEILTKRSK